MSDKCSEPWCRAKAEITCPHGSWCDADFGAHLDRLQAAKMNEIADLERTWYAALTFILGA